jgi:hypothetical protein
VCNELEKVEDCEQCSRTLLFIAVEKFMNDLDVELSELLATLETSKSLDNGLLTVS